MIKSRLPQKETLDKTQPRDDFQTPNYVTELLIPFIPKNVKWIWECACGYNKIVNVLQKYYYVHYTDLKHEDNFLDSHFDFLNKKEDWAIITNPPYSIKRKFFNKCIEYDIPFALLISADMSQWVLDAYEKYGCQALVPKCRINYITPTGLSEVSGHTAYFHSLWLTRYFNLPERLTIVELSKEAMKNI